jgi:cytochrome d ubiquinol oxidase subunit II
MGNVWFALVCVMISGWVLLDGFDFGAGVLHRFIARSDGERRQIFAAIGPVWDGNEVWLLAAGASLALAFPRVLAAGFSGLYLPVIFAVWALIVRGLSIELRNHLNDALWRAFFDVTFQGSSLLVPLLFGAALGNVIRGVPLNADGFFELPLFGTFSSLDGEAGALDWYTVLIGLFAVATVTAHGAMYLRWKTSGVVNARASVAARLFWALVVVLWVLASVATFAVTPAILLALPQRPLAWAGVAMTVLGLAIVVQSLRSKTTELIGFLASAAFVLGLLVATLGTLFPVLLRSRTNALASLTIENSAGTPTELSSGLRFWIPGLVLAAGYLWWVLRHFRGKVSPGE